MSLSLRNNPAPAVWRDTLARGYAKSRSLGGRISAMSRRSDTLGIALFPDRLVIARVSGGTRRRLVKKEIVQVAATIADVPRWRPALDALAGKLVAGEFSGADVTVVLSSHFVQYVLVPWSEQLTSEEEHLLFARHRFVRVHGAAAERWALRLSRSGPREPRLASAVDEVLINAIDNVLAPIGGRYRSLQPHFMASFNRWCTRLDRSPCWFVVAEPGLMCVALLHDGQWKSIRAIKTGPDWPNELSMVLTREQCLIDNAAECDRVMVFAPDEPAALALKSGIWKFENLQPRLLPEMAAGADAPFAIAVGV